MAAQRKPHSLADSYWAIVKLQDIDTLIYLEPRRLNFINGHSQLRRQMTATGEDLQLTVLRLAEFCSHSLQ